MNAAVAALLLAGDAKPPLAFREAENETLDPEIEALGLRPVTETSDVPVLKTVLANAFAFGGNNVSLVLTRTRPPARGWTTDELLAQKPPMRFMTEVDEVVCEEDRTPAASGRFTVPADHIMMTREGFPATGLIEVMAQTIGLYAGAANRAGGTAPKIGLLLGCRRLTFARPFYPAGSTFLTKVEEVFHSDDGLRQFSARVEWLTDDGPVPAAEAVLTVYQPKGKLPFSAPGR